MTNELKDKTIDKKQEQSYHLIGKKWTGLIIHTLMEQPKRFSEIHSIIPDLSKRVLNERLKELENSGIIIRNVVTDRPVKIEYSLTEKGSELGTALKSLENWADKWL